VSPCEHTFTHMCPNSDMHKRACAHKHTQAHKRTHAHFLASTHLAPHPCMFVPCLHRPTTERTQQGPLRATDLPAAAATAAQDSATATMRSVWQASKQHRMKVDAAASSTHSQGDGIGGGGGDGSERKRSAGSAKGLALSASAFVRNMAKMVAAHTKQAYAAARAPLKRGLW